MPTSIDTLPDMQVVDKELEDVLKDNLPDFVNVTNSSRNEVLIHRRFVAVSAFFVFIVSIALLVFQAAHDSFPYIAMFVFLLLWVVMLLSSIKQWVINDRLLAQEINMALVSILNTTLDRTFLYTHNADHKEETKQLLKDSELVTLDSLELESDDMYTAYGEKEVSFRELVVRRKVRQNKQERIIVIFKGLFIVADMAKQHKAETYISTEGDKSGFAHKSFWKDVLGLSDVEETELEWNDFEKDLHVATSDPRAAREILTPDFMLHLHEWWSEHKLNIRISFKKDKMYLLLPDETVRIKISTTSTNHSDIHKYAWSLVRPIWRGLRLVDDIKS